MSPVIVVVSLGCFKFLSSPIFQPENSWSSFGGVKVFLAGRIKFSPLFLILIISSPVPPFALTVTLNVLVAVAVNTLLLSVATKSSPFWLFFHTGSAYPSSACSSIKSKMVFSRPGIYKLKNRCPASPYILCKKQACPCHL